MDLETDDLGHRRINRCRVSSQDGRYKKIRKLNLRNGEFRFSKVDFCRNFQQRDLSIDLNYGKSKKQVAASSQ